jgi:hypothetical protein
VEPQELAGVSGDGPEYGGAQTQRSRAVAAIRQEAETDRGGTSDRATSRAELGVRHLGTAVGRTRALSASNADPPLFHVKRRPRPTARTAWRADPRREYFQKLRAGGLRVPHVSQPTGVLPAAAPHASTRDSASPADLPWHQGSDKRLGPHRHLGHWHRGPGKRPLAAIGDPQRERRRQSLKGMRLESAAGPRTPRGFDALAKGSPWSVDNRPPASARVGGTPLRPGHRPPPIPMAAAKPWAGMPAPHFARTGGLHLLSRRRDPAAEPPSRPTSALMGTTRPHQALWPSAQTMSERRLRVGSAHQPSERRPASEH